MKIAISSIGDNVDSEVSSVFGRCPYFIILEIKNGEIKKTEAIENKAKDQKGGAGISAAEGVAEKEVEAVITGNVGPRALAVLKQFKMDIYIADGAIKEALEKFKKGKLKKFQEK